MTGLTQTASVTAQITQQATGLLNSNLACVYQASNIDGSTNVSGKKGTGVIVTLKLPSVGLDHSGRAWW